MREFDTKERRDFLSYPSSDIAAFRDHPHERAAHYHRVHVG